MRYALTAQNGAAPKMVSYQGQMVPDLGQLPESYVPESWQATLLTHHLTWI